MKVFAVEIDGCAHERGAFEREAVSPGAWDFGDEMMGMEQLDQPGDAGALAFAFARVVAGTDVEMPGEVAVAEPVDEVFAAKRRGKTAPRRLGAAG